MPQQDLYLELSGDFVLTNTGDLQLADGWDLIRQNFERFVFTSPNSTDRFGNPLAGDWFAFPNFGLGAGKMIGETFDQAFISNLKQKVYQGALTAQSGNAIVPPQVDVTQGPIPNQINVETVVTPTGNQQKSISLTLP